MPFGKARPNRAKRLIVPFPPLFAEIPDPQSRDFDEEKLRLCMEDCAELIFDSNSEEEQYITSSKHLLHSLRRVRSCINGFNLNQ
jgi:hypothetical protein